MSVPTTIVSEDGKQYHRSQAGLHNVELLNGVSECAEVLDGLFADATAIVGQVKERWHSAFEHSAARARMLVNELVHPNPIGVSEEKLVEDQHLKFAPERVRQYLPAGGEVPNVSAEKHIFDEMAASALRAKQKQDVEHTLGPTIRTVLPVEDFSVLPTLLSMNDFQHADPLSTLKAEFSRSFHEIATLEAQLGQAMDEREAALRAEDIHRAEDRSSLIIALFQKMFDIIVARTERAKVAEEDVASFHENLKSFLGTVRIDEAKAKSSAVLLDAESDISALESKLEEMREANDGAALEYDGTCKDFYGQLTENLAEHNKVWEGIMALMQQLQGLAVQRNEMIREQVSVVEKEQLRRREHAELLQVATKRRDDTQQVRRNLQASLELLDYSADYIERAVAHIKAKDVDAALLKQQTEEYMRYYELYQRQVLFGGETLFRKDRRLESMKRMVRSCDFQISHAMETLDTELPRYREQRESYATSVESIAASIEHVKETLEAEAERWRVVESALGELEVEVEPPNLLLNELRCKWMQAHVQAVDDFANAEQKMVDVEKNNVRKLQNIASATKSRVESRKPSFSPGKIQRAP